MTKQQTYPTELVKPRCGKRRDEKTKQGHRWVLICSLPPNHAQTQCLDFDGYTRFKPTKPAWKPEDDE